MSQKFIEGQHYSREGRMRTLLFAYTFPYIVPGFEAFNYAARKLKAYLLNGQLHLQVGATWDGASGPTKDSWFGGRADSARATLAHDFLYLLTRTMLGKLTKHNRALYKHYQKYADKYFLRILKEDGMPMWRRHLWYRAVRWFGWNYIIGKREKRRDG